MSVGRLTSAIRYVWPVVRKPCGAAQGVGTGITEGLAKAYVASTSHSLNDLARGNSHRAIHQLPPASHFLPGAAWSDSGKSPVEKVQWKKSSSCCAWRETFFFFGLYVCATYLYVKGTSFLLREVTVGILFAFWSFATLRLTSLIDT